MKKQILDYYATPSPMTSVGKYKAQIDELPNDIGEIVKIIQGLGVYDAVASDFYGFTIPENRKSEIHIRSIEQVLKQLMFLDDKPLDEARPIEKRVVCRCHHFARLLVAVLRVKNIPARTRCGFAAYFNPGYFEDHVVCEYWNAKEKRWVFVDAQLDEVWQKNLHFQHNILDIPRDQFFIAADVWNNCHNGKADPAKFGISFNNLHGLWFIASSLIRDVAALNKMELLQWDMWGAMPKPNEELTKDQIAFFDKLASLTHDLDASFENLRKTYQDDERLRVPESVFNALLNRFEKI